MLQRREGAAWLLSRDPGEEVDSRHEKAEQTAECVRREAHQESQLAGGMATDGRWI
jgi:hypothetical protein